MALGRLRLQSAAWADLHHTIKPHIILLDPPAQSVFVEVDLASANSPVRAWLE
jgi:hypothetical protein